MRRLNDEIILTLASNARLVMQVSGGGNILFFYMSSIPRDENGQILGLNLELIKHLVSRPRSY